jgi:O-antigen ligase
LTARAELLPNRLLAAALLATAMAVGLIAGYSPPAAIGLTLGLVFLTIAMADLTAGICVFAVLTFLDSLLAGQAQGALSAPRLLGIVLMLSWLAIVTAGEREQRERIFSHPGFLFVLILLIAWTAVSALWAEAPLAALDAATRYLPNAFLFLIVYAGVRDTRQLEWVLGAFVLGALISAVYGMMSPAPDYEIGRLSGAGGGDANEVAASLVAGGILAAALTAAVRGRTIMRVGAAIAVPLCIFAVFLTLSRGGLIALGFSLIAAVIMGGKHRGAVLAAALTAATVTVVYFSMFAPAAAVERVTGLGGGTGRVDIWTVGWRMVEAEPIKGVGAGNFPIESIHYLLEPGALQRDDFIVDEPKVAHNTYLGVLAELGVIGLALFLSVIAFSLWCAAKAARVAERCGDRTIEILSRALFVALMGLLAADFFVSREYSKQLWLLMALCPVVLELSRRSAAAGRDLVRGPDRL